MGSKGKSDNPHSGDGASPGKIFIGGLPKDTQYNAFNKHFGKYGEITDSVIMKDRYTGQPRGFGFITYADPSVVDKVIEDTHVFNGKQVEIKRTIPKGSGQSKDFKTKKLFVGGIPTTFSEDELKDFFSKYGKVVEHQIIRDHETNRSRGFGFVIFDSEEVVDEMLSNGNMIDMAGTQIEDYCDSKGLSIVGYFHANERFDDLELGSVAKNIGDHIYKFLPQAALVLLDNKKLGALRNGKDMSPVMQLYTRDASKSWKLVVDGSSRLTIKEPSANIVLLDYISSGKWKDIVDFDDHLDDISKDWLNSELFK